MRETPIIPKLRYGIWDYHISKNDDGTPNGSIVSKEQGHAYCLAKQPRFVEDGEWETHAKAMASTPKMLRYLIEEWYLLGDKLMITEKALERRLYGTEKQELEKKRAELYKKFKEVEEILMDAGAFDEDKW